MTEHQDVQQTIPKDGRKGRRESQSNGGVARPMKENESDLITLDATLMMALDVPKDRSFILEIEAMMISFLANPTLENTELEPINSYYRLLVHRVARYYGVEHTVESSRPNVLQLSKSLETKLPLIKLIELLERRPVAGSRNSQMKPAVAPRRILRREPSSATNSNDNSDEARTTGAHGSSVPAVKQREQDYEKARAKIFEGFTPESVDVNSGSTPAAIADSTKSSAPEPAPVESAKSVESKPVKWKIDAAEFDPTAAKAAAQLPLPRPMFTKPIIDFETIHVPSHILLLRSTGPINAAVWKPAIDLLTTSLGVNWELRTKPTHKDALLICESINQAEHVLNDIKMPESMSVMPWRPIFYPEQ